MSQFIEMFGNPVANNKGWSTMAIKQVAPEEPSRERQTGTVWILNLDMIQSHTGKIIDKVYDEDTNLLSVAPFDEGNVLYSKLRPYLNKVVIPKSKGYATTELVPLRPNQEYLNLTFFSYLLRGDDFVTYANTISSGTKMPRIPLNDLRNFQCILPPMEEQLKFEKVAEQADKSKFVGFKSQFIEMFKNESLQVPLEKIVEVKDDCRKPINEGERSEMKEGDLYPYYGATGIVDYINDYITDEELLCIAEDCGNYKAGEESAYIIRGKAWVNNHAHLVKVKDNCDIKYLYYYLKITNLMPYVSGTTRLKLTQKKLKEILVTLPSAELQNRFVAIAEQADKSKYLN